jgi:hypothetical protein
MKTILAICAVAAFAAGCATPLASYAPSAIPTETVSYDRGTPITVSTQEHSIVAVQPPKGAPASQRPVFTVFIRNIGDAPVTIGIENVTAQTADGRPLPVISPEQLQREAQSRANWARFAAALQAMGNSMQAANAGYSYQNGTYSGSASAYGTGGSAYGTYNGTYSGMTYNSAAAAQAQATANAENAQIVANTNAHVADIMANAQSGALLRQTIAPGADFMTPVTITRPPGRTTGITLRVTIGADVHEFQWAYSAQ